MIKASEIIEKGSKAISLKELKEETPWKDEKGIVEKLGDDIYIKHMEGPLFFGATSGFQNIIKNIPDIKIVIFRLDKVPYIDQSGLYAMEEVLLELKRKNIKVLFVGLYGQVKIMFEKINIIPNLIPKDECFDTAKELEAYLEKLAKQ